MQTQTPAFDGIAADRRAHEWAQDHSDDHEGGAAWNYDDLLNQANALTEAARLIAVCAAAVAELINQDDTRGNRLAINVPDAALMMSEAFDSYLTSSAAHVFYAGIKQAYRVAA